MLSPAEQTASLHRVLLTFDDGPHPRHTVLVLDELARRELKAVFFVLGEQLESPESMAILERLAGEGHFIGNHGYSQQNLTLLTEDQIRSQIRRTETLIGNLDRGVKLWRPPFGERNNRVDAILASLDYTRMLWNVDSMDWSEDFQGDSWLDRTLDRIRSRRVRGFRNTVCLLHDSLPSTAARLGTLLDRLGELIGARVARYSPWHHEGLCLPEEPDLPDCPICPPDAIGFRVGGSRVLARTRLNAIYVLNESAGFVWDTLAGGASEPEASQTLARCYGISEDLASRDLRLALSDWRMRGLLGPKAPEMEDPGPWSRSSDELTIATIAGVEEQHAYCFLDLKFLIRFQTTDLANSIHPRFANLEVLDTEASEQVFEVSNISGGCALRLPDGVATRHSSAASAGYQLFFELVRLAHPNLDPMACLHSSLVSRGESTIALVANNGAGKSTLTAALASSGMRIVSDDRLFLDFVTRLPAATPNAVGLKRGSWPPLLSRYPGILQLPALRNDEEEVHLLLPPAPTARLLPPVRYVFFPGYSANAVTAAIPLTSVQAVERIAAADGWISSDPVKLGAFLQWIDCARCYDLPFSDLDQAVEEIEKCLRA